jgi:hypothetical protein
MVPMIARGRAALVARFACFPEAQRPIGAGSLNIVLERDFLFHAATCIAHVTRNGASLYILCDDGDVCALLSPFTIWSSPR